MLREFIVVGLLILVLGAPIGLGGTQSTQITDPAFDVRPQGLSGLDIPEPSVDLRSVSFGRSGNNLTVDIVVTNLTFMLPDQQVSYKLYGVSFSNANHSDISMEAYYQASFGWNARITCFDDSAPTCNGDIPFSFDSRNNAIHLEAPLAKIQGDVESPKAGSLVEYNNIPDAWPALALQDHAPNCDPFCHGGTNYDPGPA